MKKKNRELRIDIIDWNNRFPLDRWWRQKYNISYLSEEHRKSTFFSQLFEYMEDKLYEEHYERLDAKDEDPDPYIPMSGNWCVGPKINKKEVEDWLNTPL